MRFLLSREDGSATESELRSHLLERFGVQDRATIRNQHLGYLRTRGWIDVARDLGKENVWSVVDSPSIAGYVFAEFAGDDLAEVYRLPFVRGRVVDWYRTPRGPADPAADESGAARGGAGELGGGVSPGGSFTGSRTRPIGLSPSHYTGATTRHARGKRRRHAPAGLGTAPAPRGVRRRLEPCPPWAWGSLIADLLVDFERYGPLRRDIYAFMLRPDLHGLMASLFPPETVEMVFRCLTVLIAE